MLKMFDHDPEAKIEERDFAKQAAWVIRAPMLALAHPDPALALPAGTVLRPRLLLRNTTGASVSASVGFNWKSAAHTGQVAGPNLLLAPHETKRVDIATLPEGQRPPDDANWAAVTVKTTSKPDEVVAVAESYDATRRYGAQTPFSDQLASRWEGGEWQADALHDSITTVGNGSTKIMKAGFTLFYDQGASRYDLEQTLAPNEQMWVDIGNLIRAARPDVHGNTLPANLSRGSYQFRDLTNTAVGALFEGKVIYDLSNGHVSYGCAVCCAARNVFFVYDPFSLGVASNFSNVVMEQDTCGDAPESIESGFNNWSVANTAVAVTNRSGLHTGMSVGGTTSSTYGEVVHANGRGGCSQIQYPASGPTNVQNLTPVQHNYPGNPLPNACWISQFFDRIGANGTSHHAEDVTNSNGSGTHSSPAYGTPISAMEAGTITKLDGSEGPASPAFPACQGLRKLANTVWIQGSDGYTTRYVHLTPAPGLALGQAIAQGQYIGNLDTSGCQQGAHLHVGRNPPSGPAVNFTIPCVNPNPTGQLWDGTVDDDDTAITP